MLVPDMAEYRAPLQVAFAADDGGAVPFTLRDLAALKPSSDEETRQCRPGGGQDKEADPAKRARPLIAPTDWDNSRERKTSAPSFTEKTECRNHG